MTTYRFLADGIFVQRDDRVIAWNTQDNMPVDEAEQRIWRDAGSPKPAEYAKATPTLHAVPFEPMPGNMMPSVDVQPHAEALAQTDKTLETIEQNIAAAADVNALKEQVRALASAVRAFLKPGQPP